MYRQKRVIEEFSKHRAIPRPILSTLKHSMNTRLAIWYICMLAAVWVLL